ncbi:MAG: hypothetical protein A2202_04610 [Bdellovibrionales bacterium RIFOXYA1_FULL_36_14]|nr:MAG: hypothetical protein A2202_04610 [Bdellovibrionales bacterium RIFOXYA1_FULL_36_14]
MKNILKFLMLGLVLGTLLSCQHTHRREFSSVQRNPEKVTYGILQNEVNYLLEKTNDLKRYTVTQPDIL